MSAPEACDQDLIATIESVPPPWWCYRLFRSGLDLAEQERSR